MILLFGHRVDLILVLALTLILFGVLYGLVMLVLSRFEPAHGPHAWRARPAASAGRRIVTPDADKHVVFVLPCLNEERVIGASLDRLTALDHPRIRILVVDDGSDDGTAGIVLANPDARVSLLRRTAPNARQGKGEALNAAIRHIRGGDLVPDVDPFDVIVCVVDADGRLEPHVLEDVLPLFADTDLGAAQIGVRINNRTENLLARMQDLEFVLYTEVFQRGRRHLDSVGLGGNGQFVRLAALYSLGEAPWTRSLAEDLDLGVRLLLRGWTTDFVSTTSVHQQGLVDVRRWLRQRTRWFQGHLQSWPLVPWVLRDLYGTRRLDLLYHLTSPFLLLVGSLLTVAFALWILDLGLALLAGTLHFSGWWFSAYLVAFGPALLYGLVYWRRERENGLHPVAAVALLHLYVLYATLWYVAGWRASLRALVGRNGWAKTDRTTDDRDAATADGSDVPADAGR